MADARAGDHAPVAVVSPHLDDAVMACGQLLAERPGSVVVTVFAGRPDTYGLTDWDAAAGFVFGDDVVAARREEDRAALTILRAQPIWLDFRDSQYGPSPPAEALVDPLEAALLGTGLVSVYIPMGLFHSNHLLTHAACLRLVRRRPSWSWFAYEDALYRTLPALREERLRGLQGEGFTVKTAFSLAVGREKRDAVSAYRSQLRALSTPGRLGHDDALGDERFWSIAAAARCPQHPATAARP